MLYNGGQILVETMPQTVPVNYNHETTNDFTLHCDGGDDGQVPSPSHAFSPGLSVDIIDFSALAAADEIYAKTTALSPPPSSPSNSALMPDQNTLYELQPPLRQIKKEPNLETGCPHAINTNNFCANIKIEDALVPELSLEQVQSLAMQHVHRDIHEACEALNISPDPTFWSVDDVQSWLRWTLQIYCLPMIPLDYFRMDGTALCSLNEEDFRQRAPPCGDILFAQLDIWRTAAAHLPMSTRFSAMTSQQFRPEESVADISVFLQWGVEMGASPIRDTAPSPHSPSPAPNHSEYSGSEGLMSDDDNESVETERVERGQPTAGPPVTHSHIHLWQFLKELLVQPQLHGSCIRWLDRPKGVFKIEDSVRVARLWGRRKNRPAMNYDKLSRSIRQYYKKGIMKKTERSQRLVYQFCHPYCL